MTKIVVGSRGSSLAVIQSRQVMALLQQIAPGAEITLQIIKTKGDYLQDVPLTEIGGKGVFVKEIETALLKGEIDMAVHSMKDVPTELPPGLIIGAIPEREDPRDVLITLDGKRLADLPPGARLGTGSLRRTAQLLYHRPDLQMVQVRGNVETRYEKLKRGEFDGLVLAYAGLKRMGWLDKISEVIPAEICLPSAGQGALGLEIREDDSLMQTLAGRINHAPAAAAVTAERSFLHRMEGGCQVPLGVLGEVDQERLRLQGAIASLDGRVLIRDQESGSVHSAGAVGLALSAKFLARGAGKILEKVRRDCNA